MIRTRIAAVAVATALLGGAMVGTLAQDATPVAEEAATSGDETTQQGGAAGLVAAVVQVADTIDIEDSNIEVVTVTVDRSLNNLRALNNVLNNSPIPNENNIVIRDLVEVNNNDINALIAIGILDGGDLILFTRDRS